MEEGFELADYQEHSKVLFPNGLYHRFQQEKFEDDMSALKNSCSIRRSSCLLSLNPFIDQSGLL